MRPGIVCVFKRGRLGFSGCNYVSQRSAEGAQGRTQAAHTNTRTKRFCCKKTNCESLGHSAEKASAGITASETFPPRSPFGQLRFLYATCAKTNFVTRRLNTQTVDWTMKKGKEKLPSGGVDYTHCLLCASRSRPVATGGATLFLFFFFAPTDSRKATQIADAQIGNTVETMQRVRRTCGSYFPLQPHMLKNKHACQ